MSRISFLSILFCVFLISQAKAQVGTSPYTTDICVGSSKGLYVLDLYEGSLDDFAIDGTPRTIIYQTTGGSFVPGVGAATTNAPNHTISYVITATDITVTISASDNANLTTDDYISVSGIQFVAASANTEDIYYAGGTLAINGLSINDPVGHVNGLDVPAGANDNTSTCSTASLNYDLQNNVNVLGNNIPSSFFWTAAENPNVTGESKSLMESSYITDNITNQTATPQVVVYSVTPYSGACVGVAFTVSVTVNPGPSLSGAKSVCQGSTITYSADPAAGPYVWSQLGGTPVTGGSESDDFYQIQWNTITSTSISVNYTNSFGCSGTNFMSVSIASLAPAGSNDNTPSTCSNAELNYDLQTNVDAVDPIFSTFSWSAVDNVNVTGESLAAQSTGFITDNLINTTASDEVVVYTISPTGACGAGSNFTVEVTVHPEPVAIAGNTTVCGKGTVNFDLTSQVTNGVSTNFGWRANPLPEVEGETSGDEIPSSNISDFLDNSSGSAQTVVYTVSIKSTSDLCAGTPFTVNVVVDIPPSGNFAEETVCSDQLVSANLEGDHSTITITDNGLTQSGGTNSAGTNKLPAELTDDQWINTGVNAVDVVYDVTSYSVNGCPSLPYQVYVHVNPKPILNTPPPSACADTDLAITLETDVASVAAATFNISSITPSGALTPGGTNATIANGYLSDGIQMDKWTSSSFVSETVTYVIIPVSDQSCEGDPTNLIATINPSPNTAIVNGAPTISTGGTTNISLSSNVAGATFEYTFAGPIEITGGSSGSGSTINQQLDNSVSVQQTITYSIAATANGCGGLSQIATVFINGNPTISQADSLALVQLYTTTNGAGWTTQTNWLTGAGDTWFGIGVTNERVTSITLPSNDLMGTLPAEIGNLTDLQTLDLRQNNLSGTVPAEVYSLTALTELSLGSNQLAGSISPLIDDLVNLQILRFENLPMTGPIPAEVFNLTGLETLALSGRLNGPIPASIGAITGLTELSCDNCGITALPSQINTLANLITLNLPDNELTTLPVISALSLSSLDVSENWLTFESIEPIIATPGLVYSPQDSVGTKISVTVQTETPYSIISSVGGSANQYQWKKNAAPIPAATAANYAIASPVFEDEGSYVVEVTNTLVPGLTLITRPANLKVSSLKRDSLSLVQLYNSTNGNAWTAKTGWLSGNLSTWSGVTIASNRVTAVNLPANNLSGTVPAAIADMLSVTNIDLASNKIKSLPDLNPLTQLIAINVSSNNLGFGSLEQNVAILGKINYANQADLGAIRQDTIESGSPIKLKAITDGVNNVYQWKKSNLDVSGANDSTYTIEAIGRSQMGEYHCEITNPVIAGLTLKSALHTVFASSDLSGKLFAEPGVPATKGKITLFRVTASEAYDTIRITNVKDDGSFEFKKVVLDDYQLLGFADTIIYERALPTYYTKTIFWEEADILLVNSSLTGLDIISELEPGVPSGKGIISGIVEEDDGTGAGRVKRAKRVENAGVSARRVENTGRGKEETLTLVAYVFTNANGEFEIANLPVGEYRLNIQYPGYPMDENSFVTVPIGTALQSQVKVEAFVEEGHITVRQLIITEILGSEGYQAEVFPNPSHDFIEVTFGSVSAYREVGMFDTMGRRILNANASDTRVSVDIRSLPKGNYLLNVVEKGLQVKSLHVIIE